MLLPEMGLLEARGQREGEFSLPDEHPGSDLEKTLGYMGPELRRKAHTGDRDLEVISIWLVVVEMVQGTGGRGEEGTA